MNLGRLLNPLRSTACSVRSYGKHNKKFLYKNGQKFEGITYYPRFVFTCAVYKSKTHEIQDLLMLNLSRSGLPITRIHPWSRRNFSGCSASSR